MAADPSPEGLWSRLGRLLVALAASLHGRDSLPPLRLRKSEAAPAGGVFASRAHIEFQVMLSELHYPPIWDARRAGTAHAGRGFAQSEPDTAARRRCDGRKTR